MPTSAAEPQGGPAGSELAGHDDGFTVDAWAPRATGSPFSDDAIDELKPQRETTYRGMARRTVGIILLLVVVVLWTASNFLGSTIFADGSYSKPFFVTYINTALFLIPLAPVIAKRIYKLWKAGKLSRVTSPRSLLRMLDEHDRVGEDHDPFLRGDGGESTGHGFSGSGKLGLRATAKLSLEFCALWFAANYFAMACLQYTTVGSATILNSTSGVWTLLFGTFFGVEKFTVRKLLGVLTSLLGIFLISRVDLSDKSEDRGSFPHKSPGEVALGDAMAGFSAVLYGIYTIVMKKQVGDERRVNMQLFFGLVGFFNIVLFWPGFFILHFAGVEVFEMPQTQRVWTIVLTNSVSSLVSDICWAYAMLLTTPLVVTVGLSLTIPLSLVGQIFLQSVYSSPMYWVGAVVVFLSFLVVNHESKTVDEGGSIGSIRSGRTGSVSCADPEAYEAIPSSEEAEHFRVDSVDPTLENGTRMR